MYENNEKTNEAMQAIFFEDPASWEEDFFDSVDYAMELDKRNPVLEGICERLKHLGVVIDASDQKGLIKELNLRYRKMGVAEGVPKSVKNWLNGTHVNPSYRANLYNLCLALEMNVEEIRIFFLKNYMTIPFNFKDRVDAIYFWGVNHKLSYQKIQEIINETEQGDDISDIDFEDTQMVGKYISEIDDLNLFREYLRNNTFGQKRQYESASKEIHKLAIEDARYAEIERKIKHAPKQIRENKNGDELSEPIILKKNGFVNYKSLLFVIYGFDNQERYSNKESKISKCEFLPKAFRENFPNDQEFSRIANKTASPDVYRKAIIILKFYNFFCASLFTFLYGTDKPKDNQQEIHSIDEYKERDLVDIKGKNPIDADLEEKGKNPIDADLEDYYYETSSLLAQCGFEQMYARNPFDWLMLYCAKSTDPLETLRGLLMSRFLDTED